MGPRVDDVDLVERHRVDDLLPLLELALGALHEPDRGPHGIIISRPREGPPELRDTMRGPVDANDVARTDFFLLERLDHARACVVQIP